MTRVASSILSLIVIAALCCGCGGGNAAKSDGREDILTPLIGRKCEVCIRGDVLGNTPAVESRVSRSLLGRDRLSSIIHGKLLRVSLNWIVMDAQGNESVNGGIGFEHSNANGVVAIPRECILLIRADSEAARKDKEK